ncbi:MerR family transcriptional regulator [Levilactobacillus suantsaii]|uniref:MerR family transcriptional regulator n=1 Tax=Levilactobacillus suantsaii TaxID=2292255 RepID=A0A4V1LFF3_9LACO|nr:MerR family transcriptional regulator [Levilactobacillus suantsaii]RXI78974.1 MerR family transcriptional regulator [Levilactobacillus suantsaii]
MTKGPDKMSYSIKEAAQLVGVSTYRIRYYDQ